MALVLPQLPLFIRDASSVGAHSGTVTPVYFEPKELVDDDVHSFTSDDTLQETLRFERQMGDSELSYYLPSRANGVNDMYLHLGFRAPVRLIRRTRVRTVWAILRIRHPLLASKVEMHGYNDVRFVYHSPSSSEDALFNADEALHYRSQAKDDLIDSYLNGPRTLSNDRLSYLIVSQRNLPECSQPSPSPIDTAEGQTQRDDDSIVMDHDFLICATHFLGDGMALHAFANDFFGLLGSAKTQMELDEQLHNEWQERWGKVSDDQASALPRPLEDNFGLGKGKFRRVAARVDFQNSQNKVIGGHTFPRRSHAVRHTVVPTVPFDRERTSRILRNCKQHGVSISAALFAICNIAWARTMPDKRELPMMMYSALNLRPYFKENVRTDSYWFLAVGYFNVILPSFLPSGRDISDVFWHRARSAKEQSTRAAKNPLVASRSLEMAYERGERARIWAKEDDDKERGVWVPPVAKPASTGAARCPSSALIGLSLLGNLDGIYKHATFPEIQMHTLTTGSRQRQGGMLLFGYTFAGKLWVSLGYDENGFEKDTLDKFWANVLGGINELLD